MTLFCYVCKRHVPIGVDKDARKRYFDAYGHDNTPVKRLPRNLGRKR